MKLYFSPYTGRMILTKLDWVTDLDHKHHPEWQAEKDALTDSVVAREVYKFNVERAKCLTQPVNGMINGLGKPTKQSL